MQQNTVDGKPSLVQVMAQYRQQQATIWINVDPDRYRNVA